METQITIDLSIVIISLVSFIGSILIAVFSFLSHRLVKGYDGQIKELFERTKDLPAIRECNRWVEKELKELQGKK